MTDVLRHDRRLRQRLHPSRRGSSPRKRANVRACSWSNVGTRRGHHGGKDGFATSSSRLMMVKRLDRPSSLADERSQAPRRALAAGALLPNHPNPLCFHEVLPSFGSADGGAHQWPNVAVWANRSTPRWAGPNVREVGAATCWPKTCRVSSIGAMRLYRLRAPPPGPSRWAASSYNERADHGGEFCRQLGGSWY